MTCSADLKVLFRAAAGPRRGFGHLVRCLSLARAMNVRPLLSVRGGEAVTDAALALGGDVLADSSVRVISKLRPDVVVVDDPIRTSARSWIRAARRAGAIVVTVHDLGIGCTDADLVIDGSVTRRARPKPGTVALTGTRFAILDPRLPSTRRSAWTGRNRRVLVALGGGPRRAIALSVAEAIVASDPRAHVRVAGGFMAEPVRTSPRVTWIGAARGLREELSRATVAVVGGGVSLYEAAALGVPAIGVPVVRAQTPTVRAFEREGAAVAVPFRASEQQTAATAVALLDDARRRRQLAQRSQQLVDGQGARRAAAAVLSFVERKRS